LIGVDFLWLYNHVPLPQAKLDERLQLKLASQQIKRLRRQNLPPVVMPILIHALFLRKKLAT
jgi:hypothetical protein